MFWFIVITIGLILLAFIILRVGYIWLNTWVRKPDADYVLKFIQENPERSSLSVVRNGEVVAALQDNFLRPLASTVKTILGIEYAKQAASGAIDPAERVALDDLTAFYVPNTDGGAHGAWLRSIEEGGLVTHGRVALAEVAKGMLAYSSNANTEYLMMRLGLDRINANLESLQLSRHEPLYPFVSSLFIPYELWQRLGTDLPKKEALDRVKKQLHQMTPNDFAAEAEAIHEKLKNDRDGSYKKTAALSEWFDNEFDRLHSVKFTKATTAEYVSLMQKLNSRTYFPPDVQSHLDTIFEWPMQQENNAEQYRHLGGKGGSTAYMLTQALYAEDNAGNKTELAVFFYDILGYETSKLKHSIDAFLKKVLIDETFRGQLRG
ncbi:serine hydrolase [Numidum massiliense]|uniref:serine hydrolase n=1 Tax=Numidum massiliense TaxID=1522315 RepID=UPI0006D5738B|nr:serine hydrolase [Numidum massiliense]